MRASIFLLCLCACAPTTHQRGSIQQETTWQSLKAGVSRDQLLREFGSPSSRSAFGEETWYYVQAYKESQAFLKPKITDQKVLAVTFDGDGYVKEVTKYGLDDRENVAMVEDKTLTEGHSIGFLEQALGNLGRFNAPKREINPTGPGRR